MKKTINFIGCGKLGKTIAKLLHNSGLVKIQSIVNSTMSSTQAAIAFIGAGQSAASIEQLPKADIVFITTDDDHIQSVCERIVAANALKQGAIVAHCSGALSSACLQSAKSLGCSVVSIHPLKSFAEPNEAISSFCNTYCAIEGSDAAVVVIRELFKGIGANVFNLKHENKLRYHAASVMANNYWVTLHYHATQNFMAAGIAESTAKEIVTLLMQDAQQNMSSGDHKTALTGPLQRGDSKTVALHLHALEGYASNLYSILGLGTLSLTEHSNEKIEELRKALT